MLGSGGLLADRLLGDFVFDFCKFDFGFCCTDRFVWMWVFTCCLVLCLCAILNPFRFGELELLLLA